MIANIDEFLETFRSELETQSAVARQRRRFSLKLKQAAVALVVGRLVTPTQMAAAICVTVATMMDWMKAFGKEDAGPSKTPMIRRLRTPPPAQGAFAPVRLTATASHLNQIVAASPCIVIETTKGTKVHIPI